MSSPPDSTKAPESEDPEAEAPLSEVMADSAPVPRKDGPLWWRLLGVVRSVRPHQWVKNVFVLAPVVFAKEIFDTGLLVRAASAFLIFCLLAGAVYTINDLADIEADRQHPVKRYRPLPSGQVPVSWAVPLTGILVVGALGWAFWSNAAFFAVALVYCP